MGEVRWVLVAGREPIGADSVLTLVDPDDPGWPGDRPFKLGFPGPGPDPGTGGYLRLIPGRSFPPRPDGWAFRPIETGREDAAGMPSPDGAGPPGTIAGGDGR